MKYKLHFGYVSREDLLLRAIASIRGVFEPIHIWSQNVPPPNIDGPDIVHHALPEMSWVGTSNLQMQSSWDDDVMFTMHVDGWCQPGKAAQVKKFVEDQVASGEKWGACMSMYDVLLALNMAAVRDVGYFDPMFFQYSTDPDYYHRLRIGGWPQLEAGAQGIEHFTSSVRRTDSVYAHRVHWRTADGFDDRYYALKWGGPGGQEKYTRPFENVEAGSIDAEDLMQGAEHRPGWTGLTPYARQEKERQEHNERVARRPVRRSPFYRGPGPAQKA